MPLRPEILNDTCKCSFLKVTWEPSANMDRTGNYIIALNSGTQSISKLLDYTRRRELFWLDEEPDIFEAILKLMAVNLCGESEPSVLRVTCNESCTGM